MYLIIYSTMSESDQGKIEEIVRQSTIQGRVERCRTLTALAEKLREPADEEPLVILAPGNREDLEGILRMQGTLGNHRTIVIAPDRKMETVAASHRLRPRFLTYLNEDWEALAAVLSKMIPHSSGAGTNGKGETA